MCPASEARSERSLRAFVFSASQEGLCVHYVVYLDEFGHIGPFVSRHHKSYNDSPVFGLAGMLLPVEAVREFAIFFYQLWPPGRTCRDLAGMEMLMGFGLQTWGLQPIPA